MYVSFHSLPWSSGNTCALGERVSDDLTLLKEFWTLPEFVLLLHHIAKSLQQALQRFYWAGSNSPSQAWCPVKVVCSMDLFSSIPCLPVRATGVDFMVLEFHGFPWIWAYDSTDSHLGKG